MKKKFIIDAAPKVDANPVADPNDAVNGTELSQPTQGALATTTSVVSENNTITGKIQNVFVSPDVFEAQRRRFEESGSAIDPSDASGQQLVSASIHDATSKKKRNRRRKARGTPDDLDNFRGPWAGYQDEDRSKSGPTQQELKAAEARKAAISSPTVLQGRGSAQQAKSTPIKRVPLGEEYSVFHGDSLHDYQGRTYMHVPRDLDTRLDRDPGSQECFLPKKAIHTFKGHEKAVMAVRLFPRSGHLLLTASQDGTVRLWDMYHDRRCLRTFYGHNRGVKDICFNHDGTRFLTASYDFWVKLWDTESGECIGRFNQESIPFQVKFHPSPELQHIFLAPCSDNRIRQWDCRSGEIVLLYDQHMGPVNTVTFVDENRRFISTSDDKTLRVWDYDIPVVIKYVAEPHMHSMPAVTLHPDGKSIACQSLNGQIVLYSVGERFHFNNRKRFRGHRLSGYACEIAFSPDGRYILCGDASGSLVFWEWRTTKMVKRMEKCHDRVILSCVWHPQETSKVVTGSWDGTVKLWD